MGKFRGWHIVAGIAAMVLTGILGTAMGLNNTATFMSSCVAFVAVSLWMDSRISRRRREAARREAARRHAALGRGADAGTPPGVEHGGEPGLDVDLALDSETRKRDGRSG